jgi:hypothetical protein
VTCAASSLAAFIVGSIIGGLVILFAMSAIVGVIYQAYGNVELRRLRRVAKASFALYDDERIEGYINGDNMPEDTPADFYEVPAEAWEDFEEVVAKNVCPDEVK